MKPTKVILKCSFDEFALLEHGLGDAASYVDIVGASGIQYRSLFLVNTDTAEIIATPFDIE